MSDKFLFLQKQYNTYNNNQKKTPYQKANMLCLYFHLEETVVICYCTYTDKHKELQIVCALFYMHT